MDFKEIPVGDRQEGTEKCQCKVSFSKVAYVSCSETQLQKLSHILNPWAGSTDSICTTTEDVDNAIEDREEDEDSEIYQFLKEVLKTIRKKASDVIFST